MKFLNSISLRIKVTGAVFVTAVILFAAIAIFQTISHTSQTLKHIEAQVHIALQRLEHTVLLAEKHSSPGFTTADYFDLKPFFNQSFYPSTGFPMLIDPTGTILIHTYREGQKFSRDVMGQMHGKQLAFGCIPLNGHSSRQGESSLYFKHIEPYNAFVAVEVVHSKIMGSSWGKVFGIILIASIAVLLFIVALYFTFRPAIAAVRTMQNSLSKLATGQVAPKVEYASEDEVGKIVTSLNLHIEGIGQTTQFASAIGRGDLDTEYNILSEGDVLGAELLNMRRSLKAALEEESKRRIDDQRRSWFNSGLATFNDILRQNNSNLHQLSDVVLQSMVNYLEANQGGLFLLNDEDPKEQFLELLSAFAYNRKKLLRKIIRPGEGLVGNCVLEKHTLYLREIPHDYIEIGSGLGDASPSSLLIVPLKLEDKIFGVVELASFNEFETHQIEFVERIGESIASSLSSVKSTIRTNQLLEQSQQQREEMAAQEEEMRQNMEEMLATQEEIARKNVEMEAISLAINEGLAYAELSPKGFFNTANPNLLAILGRQREELEGKVLNDFVSQQHLFDFNSAWNSVLGGTPFRGVLVFRNERGEDAYMQCSMSASYDSSGSQQKVYFIGLDTTESKKLELKAIQQAEEIEATLVEFQVEHEMAQEKQEELENILSAMGALGPMLQAEPDGRILLANERMANLLNTNIENLQGKNLHEMVAGATQNPIEFSTAWEKVLGGTLQRVSLQFTSREQSGMLATVLIPVTDNNGSLFRVVCIGVDPS